MTDAAAPFRHVCLFTDSHEPSGVGEHLLTLAAQLRHDWHVWFVCPPAPACLPFLARAEALGLETWAHQANASGAHWERFRDWLGERNVSVFHGHAGIGWEGHDGVWAAHYGHVPAVVRTEHLPYLLTHPDQKNEHRRLIETAINAFVCVGREARRSFAQAGLPPGKLHSVQNGIHLAAGRFAATSEARAAMRRELCLPERARVILTVGRFTEQKGHSYLLDAVPDLVARVPDAHFVWVGTGPLENGLRARARALGLLPGRVHFLGRRNDVPDLLHASDLFVLPSLFEGLPLIVLEAMAAGLPVIGTHCCGTAEAITDDLTGRLVPPGDAGALARAIGDALARPDLGARWAGAARERFAREFTAERMATETAAVYEQVLRQAGRLAA